MPSYHHPSPLQAVPGFVPSVPGFVPSSSQAVPGSGIPSSQVPPSLLILSRCINKDLAKTLIYM